MRYAFLLCVLSLAACPKPLRDVAACSTDGECGAFEFCSARVCINDRAAPAIDVSAPLPEQVLATATVHLEGTVSDGSGSGVATLDYSLDGSTFRPLPLGDGAFSADVNLPVVDRKPITLAVRAFDRLGNEGSRAIPLVVDRAGPTISISEHPKALNRAHVETSVALTANASDGSGVQTLEWSLDGLTWTSSTSTATATHSLLVTDGMGPIELVWFVRATDTLGNVSVAQTEPIAIDTKAPTLTLDAPQEMALFSKEASIAIDGKAVDDGVVTLAAKIDTFPVALLVGAGGSFHGVFPVPKEDFTTHQLRVTATDRGGNVSSITRHFKVDSLGPSIVFTSPAEGALLGASAPSTVSVTGSVVDGTGASATYRIDSGSAAKLALSGGAFSVPFPLPDEDHTGHQVTVSASDAFGNTSQAVLRFNVDRKAPVITITTPTEGTVYGKSAPAKVQINGTAIDKGSFTATYAIDGAPASPLSVTTGNFSLGYTLMATDDGASHTATVQATDSAGNTASTTRHFKVDRVPPKLEITFPPQDANCASGSCQPASAVANLASPSIPFAGTVTDGTTTTLEATIDSENSSPAISQGAWAHTWSAPLSNGASFTYSVVATDQGGNTSQATRKVYVDRVMPTLASAVDKKRLVARALPLLSFSEPMDEASVEASVVFSPFTLAKLSSTDRMTYKATNPSNLSPYTVYTISFTKPVKDLAGNAFQPAALQFLTEMVAPATGVKIASNANTPRLAVDPDGRPAIAVWDTSLDDLVVYLWDGRQHWEQHQADLPDLSNGSLQGFSLEGPVATDLWLELRARALFKAASAGVGALRYAENTGLLAWTGIAGGSPDTLLAANELFGNAFMTPYSSSLELFYGHVPSLTIKSRIGDAAGWSEPTDVYTISSGGVPKGMKGGAIALTVSATTAAAYYYPSQSTAFTFGTTGGGVAITGAPPAGTNPNAWVAASHSSGGSPVVKLACSSTPWDSASWKQAQADMGTAYGPVANLELALSSTHVGLAVEDSNGNVAFGKLPNAACTAPPATPVWTPTLSGAKSPTVALDSAGNLWKAYVKSGSGELWLAP